MSSSEVTLKSREAWKDVAGAIPGWGETVKWEEPWVCSTSVGSVRASLLAFSLCVWGDRCTCLCMHVLCWCDWLCTCVCMCVQASSPSWMSCKRVIHRAAAEFVILYAEWWGWGVVVGWRGQSSVWNMLIFRFLGYVQEGRAVCRLEKE